MKGSEINIKQINCTTDGEQRGGGGKIWKENKNKEGEKKEINKKIYQ